MYNLPLPYSLLNTCHNSWMGGAEEWNGRSWREINGLGKFASFFVSQRNLFIIIQIHIQCNIQGPSSWCISVGRGWLRSGGKETVRTLQRMFTFQIFQCYPPNSKKATVEACQDSWVDKREKENNMLWNSTERTARTTHSKENCPRFSVPARKRQS